MIQLDTNLIKWLKNTNLTRAIDWTAEILYLADKKTIDDFQKGYIDNSWKSSWIVIAKWIGDPIIYNTESKEIQTAMHGVGSWQFYEIAPSLEIFNETLAIWNTLFYDKYQEEIHNDDFELHQNFINDLKKALLEITDIKYITGFLQFIQS